MMFHTAEVRWFYRGHLPVHTLAWFCAGEALAPRERTDRYLVFPGCETVGVKIREGSFEIKARKGAAETVSYAAHVAGQSEHWVKWSYHAPPVKPWVQALLAEPHGWIDVGKARWLRTFALNHDQVVEVRGTEHIDAGGTVELTRIRAQDSDWWSLALEAFGDLAQVHATLRLIAAFFFMHYSPPDPLDTVHSYAYPVWLGRL